MRSWVRQERVLGWAGPIGVALLAFVLRIWNVGFPNRLLFDETYYAKHAWSLLEFGYVREFTEQADDRIASGATDAGIFADGPTQIAHPEGGKWLIAIGEHLFGLDGFGWRISAVVVGALTVLVLARLVRRLTGSTMLGCLAGLLLCFDGMHFVMSRLALLDGFLAFWIVCAVACLVADRDHIAERVLTDQRIAAWRPWQITAGLCFGMAAATKWTGVLLLAAFGLIVVFSEVLARRRAAVMAGGSPTPWWPTTALVAMPAFASLVLVALGVYLFTWTGWLIHHDAQTERFGLEGNAFAQLWGFHQLTWDFHTGDYLAGQEHPYASHAWGWPLLDRPVAVDARNDLDPGLCGADEDSSCMRVITLLGNPALWWPGAVALVIGAVVWLRTRDHRLGWPLAAYLVSWLPWWRYDDRPIFSFYAVVMLPFMIMVICVLLRMLIGRIDPHLRPVTFGVLGVWVGVIVGLFWWFHPVLTGDMISYDGWRDRMWFSRWI